LSARKRFEKGNTYLQFEQSLAHKYYLYHLYELFKSYCKSGPKNQEHLLKSTNKVYSTVRFHTYSLPCFNQYYELFYLKGKKKIVPSHIADLLTA